MPGTTKRPGVASRLRAAGLLALLACCASTVAAVDTRRAVTQLLRDRWDAETGLPAQAATALLQDAQGYLWVGTQEGVARFDGVRFVVYGLRTSKAFRNDLVHALAETRDGSIWVGTHQGIVRIGRDSETLYSTGEGLPAQVVMAAAVARDGTLWVGTGGGGLARYRDGRFEAVGPRTLDVRCLVAASDGSLWVGTSGAGVFRVAAEAATPDVAPIAGSGPLATTTVSALGLDPAGDLWVASRAGLFTYRDGVAAPARLGQKLDGLDVASLCWDRTGTLWIGALGRGLWRVRDHATAPIVETMETADTVSAILEDRAGNVWFTTIAGGLDRLTSPVFTSVGAAEGLSSATALAVLQDREDRIWVGTVAGLSLLTSDHSAVPVAPGVIDSGVLALFEDRAGTLWVGTRTGLYRCRERSCAAEDAGGVKEDVQAFAQDPSGDVLWIGTGRGLVRRTPSGSTLLTVRDGLPHDRVTLLVHDAGGRLWVGTEAGGLARYDGGRFHRLASEAHPELAGTWALSALQDQDGSLWFGTSAGLVHARGEQVSVIRRHDGLTCDDAFTILPGAGDDLWMSCIRGIARVRRGDLLAFEAGDLGAVPMTLYKGHSAGLEGECVGSVSPSGIRARDGRLWFSTLQGVVFLDPGPVLAPPAPLVLVEALLAEEGQPIAPGREPTAFPPGTRHVDIAYTALELTRPDQVRFRYRLEGVDEAWTNAGSRRIALYPNLGPGPYRFSVEAALEGAPFGGRPGTVEFRVRPYLHQTLGFRLVLALGAVLAALAGYRARVRSFAAHRRELEVIVDRRTSELQTSVNEQRRMAEQMRAMAEEMHERSLRDPLTGLRNRRFLLEVLEPVARWEVRGSAAVGSRDGGANTSLGVALIDIDHFKAVNDTYGHDAGDEVLRQFAGRAAAGIRPGDVAARWGGEEFLVTLTATNPLHLAAFVERLRAAVAGEPFVLSQGTPVRLTCSAGYAWLPFVLEDGPAVTITDLIALADLGLYAAKRSGRDCSIGVVPGPRRGVSPELLRQALGSLDLAVAEGVVELRPSEPA